MDEIITKSVLDGEYVQLIDYMGDDDAPVDAARVSFAKDASNYTSEENDRLTNYLLRHDHGTPFEMVVYKFRIKAPVVVWWQWVRHRISSFNFVSGRYVEIDDCDVYKPMQWRMQSKSNKQGSEPGVFADPLATKEFNDRRDRQYEEAFDLYQDMLTYGIAKEQARLVLPFAAAQYEAIWCVNARSLMNFLRLRQDGHAQEEIRLYADAIRSIVSETHLRIFGKK